MTIGVWSPENRRRGLHHLVVDELGRRIVHGQLDPGAALPNELNLSTELDVSRSVVREAIRVLAAKGLVEARPRTGTRVLPRARWNLIDGDVLGWQYEAGPDVSFFRDLSEVRSFIEPRAAALAAVRRNDAESARLRDLVERMDAATDDFTGYIATDLEFHAAVLVACHNELLARMNATIATALRTSRTITARVPGGARAAMGLHREVAEAIGRGDADAASNAMNELIARAAREIEAILRRDGKGPA